MNVSFEFLTSQNIVILSCSQRKKLMDEMSRHNDTEYFKWQKSIGDFGSKSNLFKFKRYIKPTDHVIDFGCGGGFMLSRLDCKEKIGVEINKDAAVNAKKLGINCYETIDEISDEWADVVISQSVLMLIELPISQLRGLSNKLKDQGLMIISVPYESLCWKFNAQNRNKHLYTWSPMSLGNLVTAAGLEVVRIDVVKRIWPPYPIAVAVFNILGEKSFGFLCYMYRLFRLSIQMIYPTGVNADIVVVARKNKNQA
jgi:SAM-dependent methyltransferase